MYLTGFDVIARAYSNLAVSYLQLADLDQAEHYGQIGLQKQREAKNAVGESLGLAIAPRQQAEFENREARLRLSLGETEMRGLLQAGRTTTIEALLDAYR